MGLLDKILNSNPLTAAVTGGLNFASSAIQSKSNKRMMREQNNFNREEAQKQRDWQSSESQKSRDWEFDMWNKNNEYNSLSNVMKRITDAGANPFMLAGDAGTIGTGGFSSVPTAGLSPGSSSAAGVSPPYQGTNLSWGAGFSDMARAFESLANAEKTGVDTSFLRQTLTDRIGQVSAEKYLKDLEVQYGPSLKEADYQRIMKGIDVMDAEIKKYLSEKDVNDARYFTEGALTSLYYKTWEKTQAEIPGIKAKSSMLDDFFEKYYRDYVQASINQKKADANRANAQASEATSNSEWQNLNVEIRKYSKEEEKWAALERFKQQKEREGKITDKLEQELAIARKNNNFYEYYAILRGLSTGAQAIGAVTPMP